MAIGKGGKRRAEAMEGRVPRTGADACGAAAGLHTAVGARRSALLRCNLRNALYCTHAPSKKPYRVRFSLGVRQRRRRHRPRSAACALGPSATEGCRPAAAAAAAAADEIEAEERAAAAAAAAATRPAPAATAAPAAKRSRFNDAEPQPDASTVAGAEAWGGAGRRRVQAAA